MKKIFLIAVVLLMMINFIINYQHEVTKEKHTPMKDYNDPDFGYVIKYPCFFQQEDTSVSGYQGYARFSFTNHANIILESYDSLTYPDSYKPAMPRLFKLIDDWKVLGAY